MNLSENKIFTVSEFINLLNMGLKRSQAKIIGEVSEIKIPASGHVYFTLKDENGEAVINAVIWKSKYQLYGINLEVGMKINAFGHPEIYAPLGKLSFVADTIEPAGEGELKKEYERLKKKLAAEGIFDEEKKRPMPKYPQKIGLITSRHGAVLSDFSNNIGKFGFDIKLIDSRVEGQLAVTDLLGSIRTFKKQNIEVLVIIRGGGSLESMMPFNNELLVREIANFNVPVLVGIGHDKDEPLANMAADIAVSTPTAAANILNASWNQALFLVEKNESFIFDAFEGLLNKANLIINNSIFSFKNGLTRVKMTLKYLLKDIFSHFEVIIRDTSRLIAFCEEAIKNNDPERQLRLGYSIASINGKIVRKIKDAEAGQDMDIRVVDGIISSEIKTIKKNGKKYR